jgi:hypothetical protein
MADVYKPEASYEFMRELALVAKNNGDAYRDGKNAERAVEEAFRDYQHRKREQEREDLSLCRDALIRELADYWSEH